MSRSERQIAELHRLIAQEPGETEQFARFALDGLSTHIAIIDQDGTINAVNQAWRVFARANGGDEKKTSEDNNYLLICEQAEAGDSSEAKPFANSIRAVLHSRIDRFKMEYPCHSKGRRRWFIGRVTRFPSEGPPKAVIAHEDETEQKLGEEALSHAQATWVSVKIKNDRNRIRPVIADNVRGIDPSLC